MTKLNIDIRNFDIQPAELLYKQPNKSYVRLPVSKEVFFFDHPDGCYSYCLNMFGDVVHLAVYTPVELLVPKTSYNEVLLHENN